jgi:hypothetical protein
MKVARTSIREEVGVAFGIFDFTHLRTDDEALEAIREAKELVSGRPPKSLLALTDVTGSRLSLPVIAALRELVVYNDPYVIKSAVIGMTVVHRIALRQIVSLTGREIQEFTSREIAMDWLRTP